MKDETILVRHKVDYSDAKPISTPIFQTSAFKSGDPYFYSRNANPNFAEVEEVLKNLDAAESAVLLSSGMAAISATLSLLKPGDQLVVSELIYGCSYRLFCDFCEHQNISLQFADFTSQEALKAVITPKTNMVFFETPTNPFVKTIDIQQVSNQLHTANPAGIVVVDNTWATPLFQKPLLFGADIAVYSGSKFFSGHSDIIIGAVTTSKEELSKKLKGYRFYHGALPDPFNAWLLRRSLQTLGIRMERHQKSTEIVANYLKNHPRITQVYLPQVDGKQLLGYGGLLFIRLNCQAYETIQTFMNALELFDLGTSMASVASAVANPYNGSHLSMTPEEKAKISLDEFVVRLSIGLENPDDLIADLEKALETIN
jgi:cystathionine gamma-lyase/cystathionine gamma-lyase/homocysteine desulfhydrase